MDRKQAPRLTERPSASDDAARLHAESRLRELSPAKRTEYEREFNARLATLVAAGRIVK